METNTDDNDGKDPFAEAAALSLQEVVGSKELLQAVKRELAAEQAAEEKAALAEQARMNMGVQRAMRDGLGQHRLRVHQTLYMRVMADLKLKARYGDNPWLNPKFVERVWREHPECRVEPRRKVMVMRG
jgi:hypothetical protein